MSATPEDVMPEGPEGLVAADARRSLLEKYLQGTARRPAAAPPIPTRTGNEPAPLSYAQEQIWLHAQMAPELPLYNEPVTLHHTGRLNVAALERSFNEILRRHHIWRTAIVTVDGEPRQRVHPTLAMTLPVTSLRALPEQAREAEAVRLATEDARRPLDLSTPPLFRAMLIELDDERQRVYLTLSHLIFDGVSMHRVFLTELVALYDAFAAGRPSPLRDLPLQYADYACWQRRSEGSDELSAHLAYWRRELAGSRAALALPTDRRRNGAQSFRGSMQSFVLDRDLTARVKAASTAASATVFQWLLAGFAVLLHRYSGQEEIVVGSISSTSVSPQTQALIGCFVNMIALRTDLAGDPAFRELVARVRHVVLDAMAHASVPFGRVVQELSGRREPGRHPIFQAVFAVEPPVHPLGAWALTPWEVDTGVTKYDLYVQVEERSSVLVARFHYNTDLFDAATIARMAGHWQTIVTATLADPQTRLSRLPLLTDPERHRLVTEWNRTTAVCPPTTIHELFEAQVARSPDAVAVVFEREQLTYRELNVRADRLAGRLMARGVGPDVLVGLCVERSPAMVVGLLAILKAGGAYLPLAPSLPPERVAFMLADARPLLVLAEPLLRSRLPAHVPVMPLNAEADSTDVVVHGEVHPRQSGPTHLAYVLYTSGSTGRPKGVQIEHHSVVNLLVSMQNEIGFSEDDALLAVTTLSFDIAGLEIYLPLISGGRIVVAASADTRDAARLTALLARSGATVMQATPATWRLLVEAGWQGSRDLHVLCGGEALGVALASQLVDRSLALWNVYGPTETTIWSTAYRVGAPDGDLIPIGRPLRNTTVYVLDAHRHLVPVGVVGDIYIGGEGLARGYLNRPEANAERFVPDPFGGRPGTRLYKTGDRGRYRPDGNLEFLGRTDHQVKLRGFRIELGEIETTIARHAAVGGAAVVVHEDSTGDPSLVAYVAACPGRTVNGLDLREFLKRTLPEPMIPARFVVLDAIPLTSSGKVDRQSLPAADSPLEEGGVAFAAPRNVLEARLTDLWQRVLAVRPIGIRDDFFALGGHSLLAVRLFALIELGFGARLPLSALLEAPTIERLAAVLRGEGHRRDEWSSLVPIQVGGSRPPLFCVHGHFGEVLFYRPLSRRLGADQPFFGLQSSGQQGSPVLRTVERMAAHYVSEMRSIQAHGPYRLGGYCFGALVAFEMAHQLTAQGETVVLLALFMGDEGASPTLTRRLRRHLEHVRRIGVNGKLVHLARSAETRMRARLVPLVDRIFPRGAPPSSWLFPRIPEMNLLAARRYVPPPYAGPITVFMSGAAPPDFSIDPDVGVVGMRSREMTLRIVPGDRDTMMHEPFVETLAGHVSASLEEAAGLTASAPRADR